MMNGQQENVDLWSIGSPREAPLDCAMQRAREMPRGWIELDIGKLDLNGVIIDPPAGVLRAPFVRVCVGGVGGVVMTRISPPGRSFFWLPAQNGKDLSLNMNGQHLSIQLREELSSTIGTPGVWLSPFSPSTRCAQSALSEPEQAVTFEGVLTLK